MRLPESIGGEFARPATFGQPLVIAGEFGWQPVPVCVARKNPLRVSWPIISLEQAVPAGAIEKRVPGKLTQRNATLAEEFSLFDHIFEPGNSVGHAALDIGLREAQWLGQAGSVVASDLREPSRVVGGRMKSAAPTQLLLV
ncbi:MAG: hypothetical protein JWM16_6057 [Verrucomicrobiales bacterium]|nr:hypothetical protein [Verrucomicrobiales bacterium]